jgi:hypothetical protein
LRITITLTPEANTALRAASDPLRVFFDTGVRLADGNYSIPVEAETLAVLNRLRLPGETDSDLAIRLTQGYLGKRSN